MALHRVRLDSTSSEGLNQNNGQDDEMNAIEVLSFVLVIKDVTCVVYL